VNIITSSNNIKVRWEDQADINIKKGDLAAGLGIMEIKKGLEDQEVGWVVLAVVWEADLAGIMEETVVDLGDQEEEGLVDKEEDLEEGLEGDKSVDNFVFFDAEIFY
jgi:hypothetical protein